MDAAPFKSHIKLTNNQTESRGLKTYDLQKRRGHRIVVVDGITGDVEQSLCFDTWGDIYSGVRLKIFLKSLRFRANKWLIITTHDSGHNINTEAAWQELEAWGARRVQHPQHREAYVLILSTNRDQKWWEHIVDPQHYFEARYVHTITSWTKRKRKSQKNKKHKTKPKASAPDEPNQAGQTEANSFITEAQQALLSSFGANNVFFERKTVEKKGPVLLKGYLPKMKPATDEASHDDRRYSMPTPCELARRNGILPCDKEQDAFYCASCLDAADQQHMVICTHSAHQDDAACAVMQERAVQHLEKLKSLNLPHYHLEEEEKLYRVEDEGQAFHLYCVKYPDDIWSRWCNFMKVPMEEKWSNPGYVDLNIKKQHKKWNAQWYGEKHVDKNKNRHIEHEMDEKELEDDRILQAKKEDIKRYHKRFKHMIKRYKEQHADEPDIVGVDHEMTEADHSEHEEDISAETGTAENPRFVQVVLPRS